MSESLDFRSPPFSRLYSIRFFYSLEMQHENGKQHELVPTLILFCRFVFAFVTSSKVRSSLKINSGLNSLGLSQDNRICQLVPPEFARRTFLTSAGKTLLVCRVVFDVAQWNANLTSSVQIPPRPLGKQSWAIWPVLMTPGKCRPRFLVQQSQLGKLYVSPISWVKTASKQSCCINGTLKFVGLNVCFFTLSKEE